MNNQYAVWSGKDGQKFFNPNCYSEQNSVGDVIDGFECVFVGDLEECQALVDESTELLSWEAMENLA